MVQPVWQAQHPHIPIAESHSRPQIHDSWHRLNKILRSSLVQWAKTMIYRLTRMAHQRTEPEGLTPHTQTLKVTWCRSTVGWAKRGTSTKLVPSKWAPQGEWSLVRAGDEEIDLRPEQTECNTERQFFVAPAWERPLQSDIRTGAEGNIQRWPNERSCKQHDWWWHLLDGGPDRMFEEASRLRLRQCQYNQEFLQLLVKI